MTIVHTAMPEIKTVASQATPWSAFAEAVYKQKYEQDGEGWEGTARRVVSHVMDPMFPELTEELIEAVVTRKFMPGGRYLYATGKPFHQTQNCLLLRAGDSREELADLMKRVASGLMTGAGIGIVWSDLRENGALVKGMGGTSTGPLAFMQMVNEIGRHIMQGGSRRSAIWAGLHWNHPDVFDFIEMKNWPQEITDMKAKNYNAVAPMDGTNISVILDDDFFTAYEDPHHDMHTWAHKVYWLVVEQMLTTAEPGFSVDVGVNNGENLRNAPVAGYTKVLTSDGYRSVADIVGEPTSVWTGKQWAPDVVFKETNDRAQTVRVNMTGGRLIDADPSHPFLVERYHGAGTHRRMTAVDRVAASALQPGDVLHVALPNIPVDEFSSVEYTLGWVYGDGAFTVCAGADLTLCSDESKSCLPFISGYSSINESDGRGYTRMYFSAGQFTDRTKSWVPQSDITSSFIAGLFDADGNFEPTQKRVRLSSKHESFLHDIRRGLERLGIIAHVSKAGISTYGKAQGYQLVVASEFTRRFAEKIPTKRIDIQIGDYLPYRQSTVKVLSVESHVIQPVYCADVGVEEHSFMAEGVVISNCTEITSRDDNDICNLGSINMAKVDTVGEFARLVEVGTAFLLAGSRYSLVPFEEVAVTRSKNRRLGLGIMGVYEWLVKRGYRYEGNPELGTWLDEYAKSTEIAAKYADRAGISRPIKTRAIAPTGTIGIIAETTTGIEPLFAAAYKRRYLKGSDWHFQYVVDATAQRLADQYGVDIDTLETAYDLANDPARRIEFQAWVQQWVDHGISSTLNLPAWTDQPFTHKEFGTLLMNHLPKLRGVTCYPDGARGGQPLNVVSHAEAKYQVGVEYAEFGNDQACVSGSCGI